MRVLRLELGDEMGPIDLHPFVTVLQGLDPAATQRLLDAVRALAQGRDAGVGGLVENEGLLIELAPGAAATAVAVRDVIIDADHLPVDGTDELPWLLARHDQLSRQAAIDAARLEEVRTQLDPSAAARLARLGDGRDAADSIGPQARRLLRNALTAWASTPETVFVASPWVAELVRQWEDHLRRGAACEARLATLNRRVEAASRRLASAVDAVHEAETAAVPVLLDPEAENRLAELATRPVARGFLRAPRGRPDDDQAEIDELLARVGQPTYAAYVMFRMAPTPPAERLAAVEAARADVARAQQELAVATRERDEDQDLAAHRHRRDALRAVAAQHLGPLLPDDLQQALAGQGERRPNPERAAAGRRLRALAAEHGIPCPDGADDAELAAHLERRLDRSADAGPVGADAGPTPVDPVVLRRQVVRHRQALAVIERIERRAEHSRRLVDELGERIAAVGQRSRPSVGGIVAAVDRLAAEVAADGAAGAVPVVLTGSLTGLPDGAVGGLLDRLELEAGRLQLVVVTDHVDAGRWADDAGLRRALRSQVPRERK